MWTDRQTGTTLYAYCGLLDCDVPPKRRLATYKTTRRHSNNLQDHNWHHHSENLKSHTVIWVHVMHIVQKRHRNLKDEIILLYDSETWCTIPIKKYSLRMSENRVIRIFEGPSAKPGWLQFCPKFSFTLSHIFNKWSNELVEERRGSSHHLCCYSENRATPCCGFEQERSGSRIRFVFFFWK